MVGAAVVHVGSKASTQSRKSAGSKAPGNTTLAPPAIEPIHRGQAVDMEQRHHVQAAIRGAEPEDFGQDARRGMKIALRQRDDLGLRGRTRGVEHEAHVLGGSDTFAPRTVA